VYRNAVVKGFELTLETSGKLLPKVLRDYAANPGTVSRMVFKDVLRLAARHNILTPDEVGRWFSYREALNETAHDYGESLAENVLSLAKDFLRDVETLMNTLQQIQEESR
jgi:nucleotidyltransferase substrate binding protein (TIGR01987 family)